MTAVHMHVYNDEVRRYGGPTNEAVPHRPDKIMSIGIQCEINELISRIKATCR